MLPDSTALLALNDDPRGRLHASIAAELARAWPDLDLPVLTQRGHHVGGGLPKDCILLTPVDRGLLRTPTGPSPYRIITACRVGDGFARESIVLLPASGVRVAVDGAEWTVAGDLDRLPSFGSDVVLVGPGQRDLAAGRLNGRPVAAVPDAAFRMMMVALGRATAAVCLPEGDRCCTPWNYAAAVLAVHGAGGKTRAPDGKDLAHSPLAARTGWLASLRAPDLDGLVPLTLSQPPGTVRASP
ncbi:hypothetical protein AB0465_37715 [Streptomyces griseoviridis]|uniref:hypothetical protein n=1 Tax=Streptomyces griseoviridis TaxID=45398 RepID=UPI00344E0982